MSLKTILPAFLAALVGAAIGVASIRGTATPVSSPISPEPAYDRVMQTNTLNCGIMPWAPYWIVDVNTGAITGMAKDFFDDLAHLAQIKITYTPITFGNQSLELKSGRIDAVCNDGPWIVATAKVLAYTTPYYYTPMYVYVRGDETRFKTYGDINQPGIKIVSLDGDSSLELADAMFPEAKRYTISVLSDSSNQIMDVITGKADATVIDSLSAEEWNKNNDKKLKRLINIPVASYPGGMSVLPEEVQLRQFLSTAIGNANTTGLSHRIIKSFDPKGDVVMEVSPPFVFRP